MRTLSPDQVIEYKERLAIMVIVGGVPEQEAERKALKIVKGEDLAEQMSMFGGRA